MQIIEGSLGDAVNLTGPHQMTFRKTLRLPRPPTGGGGSGGGCGSVQVFLRGFDIAYLDDDRNLAHVQVELEAMSHGNSQDIDVIAHVFLADEDPVGEAIQASVRFTLVVE